MRFSRLLAASLALLVDASLADDKRGAATPISYGGQHRRCERLHEVPFISDVASSGFADSYKAVRIRNGTTTYRYLHERPQHGKPYLLLLHGFPSSSYDWRHQIRYFSERGYGLIVPDMLGYGGTDKPEDVQEYRTRTIAEDVVEILDCERIKSVFGVAHDFGSPVLSRLAHFFPERIDSYTFVDIGYSAPGSHLNRPTVEAIHRNVSAALGYVTFGYFEFFVEPRAAPTIEANEYSFFSLIYSADYAELWPVHFGPYGALEAWLTNNRTTEIADWITEEERLTHHAIFDRGGYSGPLKWYNCEFENINTQDDADIPANRSTLQKPVLLMPGSKDPIGLPSLAIGGTQPYAPDLRILPIEAGHWVQLEKRNEVNAALEAFFEELLEKEKKDKEGK